MRKGFTLIELLVVISIIGLLSSVVLVSLSTARSKARDVRRIADYAQISKALGLYFDKYGKYPNETPVGAGPWEANFNSMAQQLVTEGFLAAVPASPTGAARKYAYYNYGGPVIGGLLVTALENFTSSTIPKPPSCRPFSTGNWCDSTLASTDYCICNPY